MRAEAAEATVTIEGGVAADKDRAGTGIRQSADKLTVSVTARRPTEVDVEPVRATVRE